MKKTAAGGQPGETLLAAPSPVSPLAATPFIVMATTDELIYLQENVGDALVINTRAERVAHYSNARWWFFTDTTAHHELAREPDRIALLTSDRLADPRMRFSVESFRASSHDQRLVHGSFPEEVLSLEAGQNDVTYTLGWRRHIVVRGYETLPNNDGSDYLIDVTRPDSLGKLDHVDASYWDGQRQASDAGGS